MMGLFAAEEKTACPPPMQNALTGACAALAAYFAGHQPPYRCGQEAGWGLPVPAARLMALLARWRLAAASVCSQSNLKACLL